MHAIDKCQIDLPSIQDCIGFFLKKTVACTLENLRIRIQRKADVRTGVNPETLCRSACQIH